MIQYLPNGNSRPVLDNVFGSSLRSPAGPAPQRGEWVALFTILAAAFALRILLAVYFPNINHPDELFQYLEQGHRLAFGYGIVPWEFRDGARSWLLPGLLGSVMWLTSRLGGGAAAYLAVIAGLLSAFSLSTVVVAWLWARRLAGAAAAMLAAVVAATWFEFVYFGAKPLTEPVASETLFLAAYLLCSVPRPTRTALVSGGALLGLSFVLRFHLTVAILFIAVAGLIRGSRSGWFRCGSAFAIVVIAAGAMDWATWRYPFHSFWVNFEVNLLHDKAGHFGISPWYGYARIYVFLWSGFIVPVAILALYGARRAPLLLIVPLLIVASHTAIAHKEYRFIFPAIPFVLLSAAIGTADAVEAIRRKWPAMRGRVPYAIAGVFWLVASAVLVTGDRFRPMLTRQSESLAAMADLREGASACGVGLVSVPWYDSGGYTYLHRNVPIYAVRNPIEVGALSSAFDVAISRRDPALQALGYHVERCYADDLCLFRRSGTCDARPDAAINEHLRRTNE